MGGAGETTGEVVVLVLTVLFSLSILVAVVLFVAGCLIAGASVFRSSVSICLALSATERTGTGGLYATCWEGAGSPGKRGWSSPEPRSPLPKLTSRYSISGAASMTGTGHLIKIMINSNKPAVANVTADAFTFFCFSNPSCM